MGRTDRERKLNGAGMNTQTHFEKFTTPWEAERAQAAEELYQLERERALEDIARLIRRFDLTIEDVSACIGSFWSKANDPKVKLFEPYFSGR